MRKRNYPDRRSPATDETKDKAWMLYIMGVKEKYIAERLGYSARTVNDWIRQKKKEIKE